MNASICRPITRSTFCKTVASVNKVPLQLGVPRLVSEQIFDNYIRSSQSRRFIHSTPSLSRTPTRVRVRRTRGAADYESDLPPTSILKTAYKSGTLQLAPDAVLEFLREFQSQSSARFPGWERTVCLSKKMSPRYPRAIPNKVHRPWHRSVDFGCYCQYTGQVRECRSAEVRQRPPCDSCIVRRSCFQLQACTRRNQPGKTARRYRVITARWDSS